MATPLIDRSDEPLATPDATARAGVILTRTFQAPFGQFGRSEGQEIEFCVGGLPEKKVRKPLVSRRSKDQIGIWKIRSIDFC
ncbi:Hypothetical protein BN69_2365 [Methylocystis sp. SC2]|nr:Hypothetical protein BN69_2365 [Methylocystis sp. SC2]